MQLRTSFMQLATVLLTACTVGGSCSASLQEPLVHRDSPSASGFTYERLDKNDAVLLVVDMQEGLYQMSRDMSAVEVKNNIVAHAALGKVFNLPTILTTSSDTGLAADLFTEMALMQPA